ncbi:MAG: hypothetical protein IJU35_06060 [Paludibacteraceae bacterium]|nr:hypothetical protein [Paludibacteraceae bacterium]
MKTFTKITLCLLVVLTMVGCVGKRQSQAYYDYKSKVIGSELDGSYTIRAWGRARNSTDAYVQAQKTAVYDVIFNGVQAATTSQRNLNPLLFETNARDKYEDYFNAFFADHGEYKNFCSMKEKRVVTSHFKRTDAQTLCETTVCVFRSKLKQKLIDDGILKQ